MKIITEAYEGEIEITQQVSVVPFFIKLILAVIWSGFMAILWQIPNQQYFVILNFAFVLFMK